ncbi:DUF1304 domain-containing protein [Pseudokineococcus lusitanus]|uniref:Putative membrane protein n=1 Tax=Pseudokineococcus lusitanus TaxID=763993 RepID=A0A3N1HMG0_9ACTN|nr:DUF1304 domain-containing protein [Pseudokineococcus lusitanus]ROP43655.1 putative membrane protein [Pseudokineococcus lusitanus]
MLALGLVLAAAAAALHVVIFYLESFAWESARARAVFRTGSVADARATKFSAYNQGFYNLFLAVLVILGLLVTAAGGRTAGLTLVLAGTGCMLAAATVLLLSSRPHRGAALRQGTLPLLAVLLVALGAATG